MSKSTRNLVIAAAAASLFLAGCASEGGYGNGSSSQGSGFSSANSCNGKQANTCKGMSRCKGKARHHKKRHKAKQAATSSSETSSSDSSSSK